MFVKRFLLTVCAASIVIAGSGEVVEAGTFRRKLLFAPAAISVVGDVSTPLHATLSIDPLPPIGQPAAVTCRVTSDLDAPGTKAQIELPTNAHLVDGDLSWNGNLVARQSITFSAMIVFDTGGDSIIYCRALRPIDAKNSWGDLAALYLSVGQIETHQGFAPAPPQSQIHTGGVQPVDADRLLDAVYRTLTALFRFFSLKSR